MNSFSKAITWIARFGSIVSILVLSAFVLGGGESNDFLTRKEIVGFVFFPIGIIVGFIVAWAHEFAGGLIGTASLVAFYVWHTAVAGVFPTGPWFLIFSLPAFLFLVGSLLKGKKVFASNQ